MIHKHKTFTSTTVQGLDNAVNAFIGRQTVDGRSVERVVIFFEFTKVSSDFYTSIIYTEETLSN